jgi:hypothetical protein
MSVVASIEAERARRRVAAMQKLRDDFPTFARECLKIRPKDVLATPIVPLVLNRTQLYVHAAAQEQLARMGRVRMLIGKGRKTTVSTYVAARGFHKAIFNKGLSVQIMAHQQDTADELFDMVKRFHEHLPTRPVTSLDNAKEMEFSRLDSRIAVSTAGTKQTGRGKTPQILQWSEAAHSPNAATHFAGIVQSVPEVDGSEIWIETTGAGPSGAYNEHWQDATRGLGDYTALFVPWFWTEEYARPVEEGFTLDKDEAEYRALYDLTLEQMAWRRAKLIELKDLQLFKQEYPANANEMFEATGKQSFISPELVIAARKGSKEGIGPLVVGVDPARFGKDRFSVAWRRGRKVSKVESRSKIGTTEAMAWLRDIIDRDEPAKVFVDAGGGGDRIYDMLVSWGEPYASTLVLVNFGGKPQTEVIVERDGTKRAGPANRRSEMWMRSREWLEQTGGVDLPDTDAIQSDACAPGYHYRTTDQCLVLESKEDMLRRGVNSPDEWDAIALTFAEPVRERRQAVTEERPREMPSGPSSAWMGI